MLKKSIFALCVISIFLSVSGSGEFCVLSSPDTLTFTDSGKLDGEIVDDVLYASAGNSIEGSKEWNGLKINNPFDVTNIFAIAVEGLDQIEVSEKERCYPMFGGYSANPGLQSSDFSVVDLDLNQIDGAFEEYTSLSRESLEKMPVTTTNKHLKPELHSEDKQFLKIIEYIHVLASTYSSSKKQPDIMIIRLSIDPVIKTHGANSPAVAEAVEKLADAVENLRDAVLNASATRPLIVTIASKGGKIRAKRATESEKKGNDNPLNLAEYYNEDFPVIFNIILWFMVVFGFSLLAICYAIGSMDPGRDSIIYRMTSTRMKKDN